MLLRAAACQHSAARTLTCTRICSKFWDLNTVAASHQTITTARGFIRIAYHATIMAAPACTTVPVYDIHEDTGEILFTKAQMQQRVVEMGQQIGKDYQGLSPVLMPILKGGFIFAADLIRALDPCPDMLHVEFCSARSYGAKTETSGSVQISYDDSMVKGRNVLLVDDLVDSGLTLKTVADSVLAAGAASVKSAVLLDKRARRKVEYEADYVGFQCPNHWVAGMGMDTNQLYRSLDYVAVLKPEAIKKALGA